MTPRDLADHLARLPLQDALRTALGFAAARFADEVRDRLSHAPGSDHRYPWLRTGALWDSIGWTVSDTQDGATAIIGSTSEVARFQELGTAHVPPRPFLVPTSADLLTQIIEDVGTGIAAVLAGRRSASASDQSQSAGEFQHRTTSGIPDRGIQLAQAWLPFLLDEPPVVVRPPLPEYPSDPMSPPGPGWEWKGRPGASPGSKRGNWHNPETEESLRPELDHKPPIGPHWDYRAPDGTWYRWFPDGRLAPKA